MRILLATNPCRDENLHCAKEAAEVLRKAGLETECYPLFKAENEETAIQKKLTAFDLLLAFGGDGTILYVAKLAARKKIPVLGVNLGRTGFLSGVSEQNLPLLKQLAEGRYHVEKRMMLEVQVHRKGNCLHADLALNDVILGKSDLTNVVDLSVSIDDRPVFDLTGDGIIAATPTGSTAYSLSAGGPVMEHTLQSIVITPVCAHKLGAHTCVLHPDRKVGVTVKPHHNSAKALLLVDGRKTVALHGEDRIQIRRAGMQARFIRLDSDDFYADLHQKLE